MADNIPRFGASDFFLVETDAAALREQLRSALETVLGRTVVDADPHMVLASAFLPYLAQGQASADACAKATLRSFAVGQDLDRIADSTCVVGYLDRLPARGAVLAYHLTCSITRQDATQASVCRLKWHVERSVTADGENINFSGDGSADIPFGLTDGAAKTVTVPMYIVCEVPGAKYNGLFSESMGADADAQVTITGEEAGDAEGETYAVSDVVAERCGTTYNGSDIEDDDAFAQRVAWQAKALRVPGSLEYFKLALSSLHLLASWYVAPSVDSDGRIVMAWCDKPHFYAQALGVTLAVRGQAYDQFYEIVKSSLMVEQRAYVYPAIASGSLYRMHYQLPADTVDVSSARASVEAAWIAYQASHAWHCGVSLRVSDMLAALLGGGASNAWQEGAEPSRTLPADAFVLNSGFQLRYDGLSSDSESPVGTSGEEVTP